MFKDRKDAGKKLGRALAKYRNTDALVLALPKGGTEVGYEIAGELNLDFSLLISRKLPMPGNPETGWGAIAEDGSTVILRYGDHLSTERKNRIIEEQKNEIKRRISELRKGKPLPKIAGRTVILTDDGIATGSTMLASLKMCANQKAKAVIIAAPVGGVDIIRKLKNNADEVIVLETPFNFRAVAQVYENWYDVSDREVKDIMQRWEKSR